MRKLNLLLMLSILVLFFVFQPDSIAQSVSFLSTGEHLSGKSWAFAGGSACCGCRIDHYGNLPSTFPKGKISMVTFYLVDSRSDSYYNRIKKGPTKLKLILGGKESVATSKQVPPKFEVPDKVAWLISFKFSPPVISRPGLPWSLLDADNNIYSAVLLHSSSANLNDGIPGSYKTYDCQYSRVEKHAYSVKFDFTEVKTSTLPDDKSIVIKGKPRKDVLKTAVVEFEERGDLETKDAGAIVAEWMITALNKTKAFEVYERLSLEKLAEEHKLGMSGLLEEKTIAQIGKMRGVQAIVTGSVIKFEQIISVTAKLIDTETAKIIDSADIKVNSISAISNNIDKLAMELATE